MEMGQSNIYIWDEQHLLPWLFEHNITFLLKNFLIYIHTDRDSFMEVHTLALQKDAPCTVAH